jgi:tetratricopeptide (TPR) repeat protein
MKRFLFISGLVFFTSVAAACSGSAGGLVPGFSDETTEAATLVANANEELRKIKKMFAGSEEAIDALEKAIKNKETSKVRLMAEEFISQIEEGTALGEDAIELLDRAERLQISPEFREYLGMKSMSLRKYVDAFAERRKAAEILRDGFDPSGSRKGDDVIAEFKKREERFKELMESARQISEDANILAKESMRK